MKKTSILKQNNKTKCNKIIIYFVINKISSNVSLVEKKEYIGIFCFQPNVYHGTNIHFKLCISCLFQYTL